MAGMTTVCGGPGHWCELCQDRGCSVRTIPYGGHAGARATGNALVDSMRSVMDEALTLAAKKNADYAGADPFANFDIFGWKGVVVRISDKMQRLITLSKGHQTQVSDESIRDTLIDLLNYAAIGAVLFERERDVKA